VKNIFFTLVYSSFGPSWTLAAIAGLGLMLDSGLDESGSFISPFEDMLDCNYKNDEDGRNGKKKGAR
jgi:hypothetical protein